MPADESRQRGVDVTAIFPRHPTTRSPAVPADATQVFAPVHRLSVLATELSGLPLGPRPDFRQDLRARLLDEAARRGSRPAADGAGLTPATAIPSRPHRTGRRAAAVGLAAALVAGAATTAAAAETVPGDALYPVKRFTESVRTAVDPADRPTKPKAVQESAPAGPAALMPAAEPRPLAGTRSAPVARPAPSAAPLPAARTDRSGDTSTSTSRRSGTDRKRSGDATSGSGGSSSSSGSSSAGSRTSPVVKAPALPVPSRSGTGSTGSRTGDGATGRVVGDAVDSLRGLPVLDSIPAR